jgi:hypothetical protein
MNVAIGANVVTVIQPRRWIEWQKPDGVDAEIADVAKLGYQSREIADAIVVTVKERSHMQLIDDRVLVPELIRRDRRGVTRRAVLGFHAPRLVDEYGQEYLAPEATLVIAALVPLRSATGSGTVV